MDYIKNTINFYNQNTDEYFKNTINLQNTDWLNKFISYIPKNGKILDIGCGFGRDVLFFTSKNYKTTGIDLSKKMIEKAKKFAPNANFFIMNILNLNFKDNSFDGIWSSASLVHLNKKDVLKTLHDIKKILKPNGLLYLNLKAGDGEKIIIDNRYNNIKKFYSYYTEKEIKNILYKNNFKILDFIIEKKTKHKYKNNDTIHLIAKNKKL